MKLSKFLYLKLIILSVMMPLRMNAQQLSAAEYGLVKISALTATGNLELLKTEFNAGLDAGLTVNEIKEVLVQMYAYAGFPRSLNGINTFKTVLDERKARGIKNIDSKIQSPVSEKGDKYERGRKTLEVITKTPQPRLAKGFGEFVPKIDRFLKEHLFADIFDSDILTYKQRELATISALSAMQGTEAQLKSHIQIGKNTGITDAQLAEMAGLVEQSVSRAQANVLRRNIGLKEIPLTENDMIVRIAQILVEPRYLTEYLGFAKEVAAESIKNEPGVISIFPMQMKEDPNLIRIVEIYRSREAYEKHIASEHFQRYKQGTLKMVKDLKLLDGNALLPDEMAKIFRRVE